MILNAGDNVKLHRLISQSRSYFIQMNQLKPIFGTMIIIIIFFLP